MSRQTSVLLVPGEENPPLTGTFVKLNWKCRRPARCHACISQCRSRHIRRTAPTPRFDRSRSELRPEHRPRENRSEVCFPNRNRNWGSPLV